MLTQLSSAELAFVSMFANAQFPNLLQEVEEGIIDNVYVDLDGVVFDFEGPMAEGGYTADEFKLRPGSYLWLPPMPKALESIWVLNQAFPDRVWFLTKPPKFSPYAYVEKALAVQRYFGDDGLHKLIVTQDKSLVGTEKSIIVDDRPHKGNLEKFRGEVIHFAGPLNSPVQDDEPPKSIDWNQTLVIISTIIKHRQRSL